VIYVRRWFVGAGMAVWWERVRRPTWSRGATWSGEVERNVLLMVLVGIRALVRSAFVLQAAPPSAKTD